MSKEDLLRFQAKYGDEYSIENSPVARWILEYGWSGEDDTKVQHSPNPKTSLRERIKQSTEKSYPKADD